MDPFGNSGITPLLFENYGYDAFVTCAGRLPQMRLGHGDGLPKGSRWHWQQQLQNVWKGSGGSTIMQHIIEGMYMELSGDPYWPGHGYLWESGLPAVLLAAGEAPEQLARHAKRKFGATEAPFGTSPAVNASNLARLSADLVRRGRDYTQWYQTALSTDGRPTVFLPWGGDWTFSEDAHIMFKNMDQIVNYINAHSAELNATIKYGTLERYLDVVHGAGQGVATTSESKFTLPVVEGSFMGNDDDCCQAGDVKKVHSCWTGYYSSFPALKLAVRELDTALRHAEIASLLATPKAKAGEVQRWEAALGWGRHTQGIMQHHDALTGTGGATCDTEYHTMLANATQLCRNVVANASSAMLGIGAGEQLLLPVYPPKVIPTAPNTPAPGPIPGCASKQAKYDDCHTSDPDKCRAIGCCWTPHAKHYWCYRPSNRTAPPAPAPPGGSGGWPTDGTVLVLPASGELTIVAANSLGWARIDAAAFKVLSTSAAMVLTDAKTGQSVLAQLAPPEPVNASMTGAGSHAARHEAWAAWAASAFGAQTMSRLVFQVIMPALGAASYTLRAATAADVAADRVAISNVTVGDGKKPYVLDHNPKLRLEVSSSGLLNAVTVGAGVKPSPATTLPLNQDFVMYWGNGGRSAPSADNDGVGGDGGSESDAYVFSPQGSAASLARVSGAADRGFWPNTTANKPALTSSAILIAGPLFEEVSTAFAVGETALWQAVRVFNTIDGVGPPFSSGVEMAYLVEKLASNQDVMSRFSTPLKTNGLLHADEAGWTTRAHPREDNYDSLQSKISCNFHPSSGWAGVQSASGDGSMFMLTDRSRAVASTADGSFEYVIHRHADGGNGRGPSDGDDNAARGAVTLLFASSRETYMDSEGIRPLLALRRAHPTALLYTADAATGAAAKAGLPGLANGLPFSVHMFSLQRRAFQNGGGAGHVPDYPRDGMQGVLRLQGTQPKSCVRESSCSADASVTVDVAALFASSLLAADVAEGKLTETTLSLTKRPDQVRRRAWKGAGMSSFVTTPAGWRDLAAVSNSSKVRLVPEQIKSFVFAVGTEPTQ